jgi:tripartite-type tricarboxylate transporter receptor subunit TctC
VIGVSARERVPALPEVPTISEAGVPGFVEGNWQGVLVPSGTPQPIITKLNRELVRIVTTTDVNEQILRVGADVVASTPAQFAAVIRADLKRYADLIKAQGIRAD